MNLAMSEKAIPLYEAVKQFIKNEVEPITEEYYALGDGRANRWSYAPGQLELLDQVQLALDLRAGAVVVRPVAITRAHLCDAAQERRLRLARRHRVFRKAIAQVRQREVQPLGQRRILRRQDRGRQAPRTYRVNLAHCK